jgi:serine/threonine protein phosphatase PrpC
MRVVGVPVERKPRLTGGFRQWPGRPFIWPTEAIWENGAWNVEWRLDTTCVRLADWMTERGPFGRVPWSQAFMALSSFLELICALHEKGHGLTILDPRRLALRPCRANCSMVVALMTEDPPRLGATPRDFVAYAGFVPPEVTVAGEITAASDVMLGGAFAICLLTGRLGFASAGELEFIAHNVRAAARDLPPQVHPWLGRSCAVERERRFANPRQQLEALTRIVDRIHSREAVQTAPLRIGAGAARACGVGKLRWEDDFRLDDEVNEDRCYYGLHDDVALGLVADGVSRSHIGSGALAAEIVRITVKQAWESGQITCTEDATAVLAAAHTAISETVLKLPHRESELKVKWKAREPAAHVTVRWIDSMRAKLNNLKDKARRRTRQPVRELWIRQRRTVTDFFTHRAVPTSCRALRLFVSNVENHCRRAVRRRCEKDQVTRRRIGQEVGGFDSQHDAVMASTAVLCFVTSGVVTIMSCGDSRAYLWCPDDGLMLLTADGNVANAELAGEVSSSQDGSRVLVEFLGGRYPPPNGQQLDPPLLRTHSVRLLPGDLVLLATDGLTDYLDGESALGPWSSERALGSLLAQAADRSMTAKAIAEMLVAEANRAGGGDNVAVVVMKAYPVTDQVIVA